MSLTGLADQIRRARVSAGLTQQELGERISLSGTDKGSTVSRWERGTRNPQLAHLSKLAQVTEHELLIELVPKDDEAVAITCSRPVRELVALAQDLDVEALATLTQTARLLRKSGAERGAL